MRMYRIKRFGWLPDPLDHRDYRLDTPAVAKATDRAAKKSKRKIKARPPQKVPPRVDLRDTCTPIEDQGDIGSCTAQAVVGLLECLWKQTHGQHLDASRLFLYKVTRNLLGWEGDTGAFVRTAIKAAKLFGVCPEDYWSYDEETFDEEPPAFCYSFARSYKTLVYYRLEEKLPALKASLAQGIPFAFGFTCFASIDDVPSQGKDRGVIPFPEKDESDVGGHAVVAVGYEEKRKQFIIRNSWGTDWGDGGYGYLPYEYFEAELADDCWCLLKTEFDDPQN